MYFCGHQTCPLRGSLLPALIFIDLPEGMRHKGVLQDTDTSVREATANAFGLLSANLAAENSSFSTGDTTSNPVLRAIFESLGAQQKEVNLSASQALLKAGIPAPSFPASLI